MPILPDDGYRLPRRMEDSLPPEDRLPREDACSMDEFNERLPAQPPEETRKSGSRRLLRRLVTAAIAVAALSLAANQIDPLASRAEAKIPVMHEDPILQPTEPAEVSAEHEVEILAVES